jgi:hypothetical protein
MTDKIRVGTMLLEEYPSAGIIRAWHRALCHRLVLYPIQ